MDSVVLEGISKCFDKNEPAALEEISFVVKEHELFGLIGPDGAGKTTLFRILATLLLADRGSAQIQGIDILKEYQSVRKKIGYMPGKFSLYQDLSVEENLHFFATIFNTSIEKNYDLIKDIYVQLEPFKTRRSGKLSGGMKQKLALCCALIHRPNVLLLDEPTTGVDTVSRKEFWEILKNLKNQGITILVSTSYMDEADLCERIALIQSGKILSVNTPQHIIEQYQDNLFAIKSDNMGLLLKELKKNKHLSSLNAFGEYHHITFNQNDNHSHEVFLEELDNAVHTNLTLHPIDPTIEDCFIKLMG